MNGRIRRALAMAGVLASLAAALVFAPAASASQYCGGFLAGEATCSGNARSLTGVKGTGQEHIVCVWADSLTRICTSEPGAWAAISYGSVAVRTPRIRNQAASGSWVQGETF